MPKLQCQTCGGMAEVDQKLRGEMLRELTGKVKNRQNAEIPELCRQLQNEIKIRNEQCKACK